MIALGAAMGGPLVLALMTGEEAAGAYFFSACLTMFAGAGCVLLAGDKQPETDFRGALMLVLLWWCLGPVFAAIPLVLSGLALADAYFETASALTTTGAWLSKEQLFATDAGLLWRAELQWIGGLASLAIAAAIFIRPAFIGIDTLLPPFSRGDSASFIRPIGNALRAFVAPYALVTVAAIIGLTVIGVGAFDALVMAMSAVASGGLVPHEEGLSALPAPTASVLFPIIFLSGANFVLIARVIRWNAWRSRDVETVAYILMTLAVGVLLWFAAGAAGLARLPAEIFNAASLLSTSGLIIGEAPPLTIILITSIIGGAAVSTAGGFKVLRWLVIMRRAREEIRRLVLPSGVFGSSRVANELGVWMHFLVFTMTLGGLVLAVTAGGHSFEIAVTTATAVLSNSGPLLALAEGGAEGYAMFDGPLRIVLIVGMILGRLEAVAALALINPAFWRS